jgi:hypothetical protein
MSRAAVITDIHGNLAALEAALAEIDRLEVEKTFCGGDLVGYGPWPNEVCREIEERGVPTIYGNYDYDADLASREVAAAGLPSELAEKLLIAA